MFSGRIACDHVSGQGAYNPSGWIKESGNPSGWIKESGNPSGWIKESGLQ